MRQNKINNINMGRRIIKVICNIMHKGLLMPSSDGGMNIRASATLEASLVIPLFIYAVMSISYIIYALGVSERISQALYNDARYMARYIYMTGNKDGLQLKVLLYQMSQAKLYTELGKDYASTHNVAGGNAGLIISCTQIIDNNNNIKLSIKYAIKNPFDIFGTKRLDFEQSYTERAWLGQPYQQENINENDECVYITAQGDVYHKDSGCTYLKPSVRTVNYNDINIYRNSAGAIYYQCERCKGHVDTHVYITDYGTRYHTTDNCSELKRNAIKIRLSCVDDMRGCSKCT